jgi:hypothetical protein
MTSSGSHRCALLALSVWLTACTPSGPDLGPVPADDCVLSVGSWSRDTIVVSLSGSVEPQHAPIPRSPGEQVLFRNLYQTLINVDCRGMVTPGLAESWEVHDDARIWSFVLHPDAAFWDGAPVTAASVREGWLLGQAEGVAPWADSVAGSVTVTGERRLTVRLRRPYENVPRVFADPTLAVARSVDSAHAWPLGTGAYHVAESSSGSMRVAPFGSVSGDDLPVLHFLDVGDDPRDAIDLGADLVLSRTPLMVDYVADMEDLQSLRLPWDRVYALVAPLRTALVTASDSGPSLAGAIGVGTVQAESRISDAAPWWADLSVCRLTGALSTPARPGAIAGRIVYRRGDPDGRAIAERLVALAASRALPGVTETRERLTAAGLSEDRFARALADGRDLGFVVPLPSRVLDPCAMIGPMRRVMPWLAAADLGRVVVPLLETRGHVIVRRGVGSVLTTWDGVPFLAVASGP